MLEAYSTNQTILTSGILPFNSTSVAKGCTATLNGVSTIELNKAGVYEVVLNVSGLPSEAGNITINLMKDNVLQSGNNINIPTVVTTQGVSANMTALIKVTTNNSCKCNSSPVSLQFINSGVGLTSANLNVVVTKLC
nr:MAG TPA: hypothetical protein [Caudoviricetes sp.]